MRQGNGYLLKSVSLKIERREKEQRELQRRKLKEAQLNELKFEIRNPEDQRRPEEEERPEDQYILKIYLEKLKIKEIY